MKKLGLASLLVAGLAQTTGCIIITDDDSGSVFEVSWDLVDRGSTVTCSSKNATSVRITATDSFGADFTATFACADGVADLDPLPLDTYDLSVELLDGTGTVIGGPVNYNDRVLDTDGQTVTIGPVHFDFSRYDVSFIVDYGTGVGGSNCTEATVGGNGVAAQRVSVYNLGGQQCLNYTLVLGAPGDSTPDDTCGSIDVCQENVVSEEQVIQDMPPGSYEIQIEGLKNNTSASFDTCYITTLPFTLDNNQAFDYQLSSSSANPGIIVVPFDINAPAGPCQAKR